MAMYVTGSLLDTERKTDSFTNEAGDKVPYDFTVLHVLDGRVVRKLRLPKGVHVHPWSNGDQIEVEVEVFGQPKTVIAPESLIAQHKKSA